MNNEVAKSRLGPLSLLISSGSTPLGGETVYLESGPVALIRSQNVRMNAIDLSNVAFISEEINSGMQRSVVARGDVLLNITGASIGRVAHFNMALRANVNQHVCIIRPRPDALESRYLTYFLSSPQIQHDINNRHQHGGTRQALTFSQIADLEIPIPELSEQRRVADILDEADELRGIRAEAIRFANDLVPNLFNEMFGDTRTNPMNWPMQPVSQFTEAFEGGKNLLADDDSVVEARYRILKVSAVTWQEYDPTESKPLPQDYSPPSNHFVRQGDLLFSRANTTELVGATAYVWSTPNNRILPDKIWRFVWKEPKTVDPLYIWSLFQDPYVRFQIGQRATGTSGSMKNISMPKVMSLLVPVPPLKRQQEFAEQVRIHREILERQMQSRCELDNLFHSLLQRAFRGEL